MLKLQGKGSETNATSCTEEQNENKNRDAGLQLIEEKIFLQEIVVDSLRHSDWTITLPLIIIDLHAIAEGSEPLNKHIFGSFVAAGLQPLIIGLGSIPRFLVNNFQQGGNGSSSSSALKVYAVGALCFFIACCLWVLTTVNLLLHCGWPQKSTAAATESAVVIWAIAIVQVGYPVVACMQFGCNTKNRKAGRVSPQMSLFKDILFGILDSLTKGGLALFISLSSTRQHLSS
jgi:bacteriorhodopsin